MIDTWRQKETIFAIESFFVRRIAPRLAVAGNQVREIFDTGNAASSFDFGYSVLEQSLSVPGTNDRQPLGLWHSRIVHKLLLQSALPELQIVGDNRFHRACRESQRFYLFPDKTHQYLSE